MEIKLNSFGFCTLYTVVTLVVHTILLSIISWNTRLKYFIFVSISKTAFCLFTAGMCNTKIHSFLYVYRVNAITQQRIIIDIWINITSVYEGTSIS